MWIPQWLVIVGGAAIVVLAAVLLFVAQYGGLRHAYDEFQAANVSFQNTTASTLCFGDGNPPTSTCAREIKPLTRTDWSPGSCKGSALVTVYDPETLREIYRRGEPCGGFDGATIIINNRDGEFVVADSLQPRSPQLTPPSNPDATTTPTTAH